MIIIQGAKKYTVYCRTNKHIRWTYSTYAGCYDTIEQAIEEIKKHISGKFQWLAQDNDTGEETIGEAG